MRALSRCRHLEPSETSTGTNCSALGLIELTFHSARLLQSGKRYNCKFAQTPITRSTMQLWESRTRLYLWERTAASQPVLRRFDLFPTPVVRCSSAAEYPSDFGQMHVAFL